MEVVLANIWLPLMGLAAVSALAWLGLYWTRDAISAEEFDRRKTTRVAIPGMAEMAPIDAYAVDPSIIDTQQPEDWPPKSEPEPAPPMRRGNPPPFPPPTPARDMTAALSPPRLAGESPVDPNAPTPPSRWTPAIPGPRRVEEPPPTPRAVVPPPPIPPPALPSPMIAPPPTPRRDLVVPTRKMEDEPPTVSTLRPPAEEGPPVISTRKAEPPAIQTRKGAPAPPPFIKSRRIEPKAPGWTPPDPEDAPTTEKMLDSSPPPAPPAPWGIPPPDAPPPPPVTPYDPETARPFAPRTQGPPIIDSRRRGLPVSRIGSNLVINVPAQPAQSGLAVLPPRLEVIYGNFSPSDPREILLYQKVEPREDVRIVFSSSPGESINHLQLNHFTVYPEVHAEMVRLGEHDFVLHNRVPHGQEERFQTRVNGAVLNEGESRRLQSGDILSLGIYRLRYSL